MEVLDTMDGSVVREMVAVHEHEGSIYFVWNTYVPEGYEEGGEVFLTGDNWSIVKSICLQGESEEME